MDKDNTTKNIDHDIRIMVLLTRMVIIMRIPVSTMIITMLIAIIVIVVIMLIMMIIIIMIMLRKTIAVMMTAEKTGNGIIIMILHIITMIKDSSIDNKGGINTKCGDDEMKIIISIVKMVTPFISIVISSTVFIGVISSYFFSVYRIKDNSLKMALLC